MVMPNNIRGHVERKFTFDQDCDKHKQSDLVQHVRPRIQLKLFMRERTLMDGW